MRVDLPMLDLPVSRTGVELHYSPRFRVEPQPGAFRVAIDPGRTAVVLRGGTAGALDKTPEKDDRAAASLQALVDQYKSQSGGRTIVGALPVHVPFPAYGPSIFLASELTAEGTTPSVEFAFKRSGN
jgi:hypothetical protein